MISSSSNPRIKFLKSLRDKKRARSEADLFFVEGLREVERAIRSGLGCEYLVYCQETLDRLGTSLVEKTKASHPPLLVSREIFSQLVVRDEAAGLCGVFKTPHPSLNELRFKSTPLLLVVENLEKPGNLGALLRSADGAGVDAVLLTGSSVEIFNPNVIRSSLGTVFQVPTIACSNEEVLAFCRQRNIRCIAASPSASQTYYQADFLPPTAFILGNEANGLSEFWLSPCEGVALPMRGIADSLNISATGAILVYEAMRQRETAGQAPD